MIGRQVFDCFEDVGRFPEGLGHGRRVLFVGELSEHLCEFAAKTQPQWLDIPYGQVGSKYMPPWRELKWAHHLKTSPASTGAQERG